ncbi:MAG: hypothetical protein NC212_08065 [Staphylococcus sp.]|nr:hypothetical protein [Staphylococcus sp.]
MITLNVPLVTWFVIAFAMLALVIVRAFLKTNSHHTGSRRHHLIEIGSEREEFFIPGDRPVKNDSYDYDDD